MKMIELLEDQGVVEDYHLVRIPSAHVATLWNIIKPSLVLSLEARYAQREDVLGNILQALMQGHLECWTLVIIKDKDKQETLEDLYKNASMPVLVMTTMFITDTIAGIKSLYIYSLSGFSKLPKSVYVYGFEKMRQYARARGAEQIIARTNNPFLLRLAKQLGDVTEAHSVLIGVD